MVKAQPGGYGSVTAYLIAADAAAAIRFYQAAFGARKRMRLAMPGGKIGHAELDIGDSVVMLADESPDHRALRQPEAEARAITLHLYVDDADATVAAAVAAGAHAREPVTDKFYGDRSGTIVDPFGHVWHIATHVEDVSEAEIGRRLAAMAPSAP